MADLQKISPEILSKATPEAEDLLRVRAAIQHDMLIRDLFNKGASVEAISTALAWKEGQPEAAVQYLLDEHTQLGSEGICIVDTKTGKVAVVLGQDDIYQPAPVPREGTSKLAQPLPRLRPDLEAALFGWVHDRDRESKALAVLAKRGVNTELLKDLGDPQLLAASRRGRKHIVDALGRLEPEALLSSAGGSARVFLNLFKLVREEPSEEGLKYIQGVATSRSVSGVQDPFTMNLRHSRPRTLQGTTVVGWIRSLAGALAAEAHKGDAAQVKAQDTPRGTLWVAPPDLVRPFHEIHPGVPVLSIEGPTPVLLGDNVGYLRIPEKFLASNLEIFDRWEATTEMPFEMWVDLKRVQAFEIVDVDLMPQVL